MPLLEEMGLGIGVMGVLASMPNMIRSIISNMKALLAGEKPGAEAVVRGPRVCKKTPMSTERPEPRCPSSPR